MKIYQFIKYNSDTTIRSLIEKNQNGEVICFDLEDSAKNWINEKETLNKKFLYRKTLNRILINIQTNNAYIKFGIRINSRCSNEQSFDFDTFPNNLNIHSIIIPKVETKQDVEIVIDKLNQKHINYQEIIATIETKKGIENLSEIIKANNHQISIGFGHLDYNLNINAFPFFHQNSYEYWKWVDYIINVLKPHKITFINSLYTSLSNYSFLKSILSHLQYIYPENFGQFTLTIQQTKTCAEFDSKPMPINRFLQRRLNLGLDTNYLNSIIITFENENKNQAFTITEDEQLFISPHEYFLAKQLKNNLDRKNINFIFVGGCFPVQHDILFEDTFHQIIKEMVERKYNVNLNINIIRYERFSGCLAKIEKIVDKQGADFLVFHIRPEPLLRMIKLFYKFKDNENKLCYSFNLAFTSLMNPEKYDVLDAENATNSKKENSKFYKILINVNYLLGFLIGNLKYALKKSVDLVFDIAVFCQNNKIDFLVLGPPFQKITIFEMLFSKKLEHYVSSSVRKLNLKYIFCQIKHQENGVKYFNDNGIHATKEYHKLIAVKILENIKDKI